MPVVDLNADLGERVDFGETERLVLGAVTSTSVSCGAHAGSMKAIRATVEAAAAGGVVIGAHPSYPDRAGAGRRAMDIGEEELAASLVSQIAVIVDLARAAGSRCRFVKPHGELYNRITTDGALGAVVVEAVLAADAPVLLLPAGSVTAALAEGRGLTCAAEGFCDRSYLADGRLVSRRERGAVLTDEAAVVDQALSIALHGGVRAVDGTWVDLSVDSLCVHGDTPGASRLAVRVRRALEEAGAWLAPFADENPSTAP